MKELCGEVCPTDETVKCENTPHRFGEHYGSSWALSTGLTTKVWPGTPKPPGGDKPSPKRNKDIAEKVGAVAPAPTVGPPTPEHSMQPTLEGHRDGETYVAEFDYNRLNGQQRAVFEALRRGGWWTLAEIGEATGHPEASVSARIRDLRKPQYGGLEVHRRHRGAPADGLYEYQLIYEEPA